MSIIQPTKPDFSLEPARQKNIRREYRPEKDFHGMHAHIEATRRLTSDKGLKRSSKNVHAYLAQNEQWIPELRGTIENPAQLYGMRERIRNIIKRKALSLEGTCIRGDHMRSQAGAFVDESLPHTNDRRGVMVTGHDANDEHGDVYDDRKPPKRYLLIRKLIANVLVVPGNEPYQASILVAGDDAAEGGYRAQIIKGGEVLMPSTADMIPLQLGQLDSPDNVEDAALQQLVAECLAAKERIYNGLSGDVGLFGTLYSSRNPGRFPGDAFLQFRLPKPVHQ